MGKRGKMGSKMMGGKMSMFGGVSKMGKKFMAKFSNKFSTDSNSSPKPFATQSFHISSRKFGDSCLDAGSKKLTLAKCDPKSRSQRFAVEDGMVVYNGNCISRTLVQGPCTPDSLTAAATGGNNLVHTLVVGTKCVKARTTTQVKAVNCKGNGKKFKFLVTPN